MENDEIKSSIMGIARKLGINPENVTIEHPKDSANGDTSTNIAFIHARQVGASSSATAQKIIDEYKEDFPKDIKKVVVGGAGFVNFHRPREFFTNVTKEILKQKENWGKNKLMEGKKVMVEYTDPNPFKPFHIGHLMTNAIGESIARIMEYSGANTIRANYQGDVGPHVAKAIYGIMWLSPIEESNAKVASTEPAGELAQWIGECYSKGSTAYEEDAGVKRQIDEINKKVYDKSDIEINKIYDWGRDVTLRAFEEIYSILDTKFNHYFFESDMAPIGQMTVEENVGPVFTKSEGAIVFHAENYDPKLHTRVFITSIGIPLYETKEIGLTMTKFEKENPDLSIVVTAIEQGEYMKVVAKAISLIHPDYEKRMKHITHGMMKFASGKMSSRKGNVITGESLIRDSMDIVAEKVKDRELSGEEKKNIAEVVGVSAVKYSILRSSLTGDIVYDFEKSISFEGDSGPYLQYTAVRANSILKKGKAEGIAVAYKDIPNEVTTLEKVLYQFPEVVVRSYTLLEPHHIATYLTELASAFNTFYGNTIIVNKNDPYANYRVALVEAFHQTMKNGLYLLGIKTPEKM